MENKDDAERGFDAWRHGKHERPAWQHDADDSDAMRGLPDWWELEVERFDGAWLIEDGCKSRKKSVLAASVARLVVLQVALRCIRRQSRGEDISDHVHVTRAYVAGLELNAGERGRLQRILAALQPFDVVTAADALMAAAWSTQNAGQHGSAQSLLTAAYECARRFALHDVAAAAAQAFARMARMHECPRAARKWQGRAYVHARRAARCYRC